MQHWGSGNRYRYLHDQLRRYTEACELGYDVHVVLSTYAPWNYTGVLDMGAHFCSRTMSTLPVTVRENEFEPLPNGTFGTLGTLAFKHRLVFLEEQRNYDLFISQEDDVAVEPHHLSYFLRWAAVLEGTDFYPGFSHFELLQWDKQGNRISSGSLNTISSSRVAVDRLTWNHLYRINGINQTYFLSLAAPNCCLYMLTQSMLMKATSRADWLGSLHTHKGEFNPYFGTAVWLTPFYRIVIPVSEVQHSLFHHLPDKYAKNISVSFGEVVRALDTCLGANTFPHSWVDSADAQTKISYDGNCPKCLGSGGAARMLLKRQGSSGRNALHVKYDCVIGAELDQRNLWPWYKGKSRGLAPRAPQL